MSRWLEVMAAAKEGFHEVLLDPDQHHTLSPRMQKLLERSAGSGYTDLDGTDVWHLWRFWAEAPAGGEDAVQTFLDRVFTEEYTHFRPFSVWWWDTGMMLGTEYEPGPDGDAGDVDLTKAPVFPFDYQKAKRFIPDLVLGEDPEDIINIIHDMRPGMVTTGQFSESRGEYHQQRRVKQRTSNQKLGADAFGKPPWSPAVAKAR